MAILAEGRIALEGEPARADRRPAGPGLAARLRQGRPDRARAPAAGDRHPAARRPHRGAPWPNHRPAAGFDAGGGHAGGRLLRDPASAPPGHGRRLKAAACSATSPPSSCATSCAARCSGSAALLFFLMAFGATTSDQIQIGSRGNVNLNAPFILQTLGIMSLFGIFVHRLGRRRVIRDDETGFAPILRATRVGKADYVGGRFVGSATAVAFLVLACMPLAIAIGSACPGSTPTRSAPSCRRTTPTRSSSFALPTLLVIGRDLLRAGHRHAQPDVDLCRRGGAAGAVRHPRRCCATRPSTPGRRWPTPSASGAGHRHQVLDGGRAQHAAAAADGLLLANRLLWLGIVGLRCWRWPTGAFRMDGPPLWQRARPRPPAGTPPTTAAGPLAGRRGRRQAGGAAGGWRATTWPSCSAARPSSC
jgi:hypothetical protein